MLLRKEISFAIIAIFLATLASGERVKRMYALCPPDFVRIGSECYYISTERVNWLDAHFDCKDRNSRLAEPIKHEDQSVRKFLMHNDEVERSDVWIGGIYNWERKKWQWGYNGRDIAYQSFSQMMPGSSQDLRFHCAVLNPQLKYRWSARSCVDKHHYICQHRMPYVSDKNRQRIYNKWNETYPNRMANEIEVVLTEEELQRKENRRQQQRIHHEQNMNRNSKKQAVTDDRSTNSIDWQQPQQPQQPQKPQQPHKSQSNSRWNNNFNRKKTRKQRKRIPNNFNSDVANDIDSANNNRVPDKTFHLDAGYGLKPGVRRNRTRNPNHNRNSDLFGAHRGRRKHKHSTTTTTTTSAPSTTTTTTTEATTETPTTPSTTTYVPPVNRHRVQEPTSAEERYRIENEQIRMQEEVRRRQEEETIRQQKDYEMRSKHRHEMEERRAEIEDREALKRKQQFLHEQQMEEDSLRRQQEDRKRLQFEQEQNRQATEIRELGPSSVEQQRRDEPSQANDRQLNEVDNEEARQPIDDTRLQLMRQQEVKQRRDQLRKRLQKLSPEELKEFYAKRAQRNQKRDAAKKESAPTSIPDQ